MSTTGGTEQGTVCILDAPDDRPEEVQDGSDRLGPRDRSTPPDKPGISNLIEIMTVATGESIAEIQARYDGAGLRRVQDRRRRGGDRAARAVPAAVPRAPRRPRRAPAAPRSGRRQGTRGVRSRRSTRCTSEWASPGPRRAPRRRVGACELLSAATSSRVSSRHSPRREAHEPQPRVDAAVEALARDARPPRTSASPGGCGPRAASARGGDPEPRRRRAPAGAVVPVVELDCRREAVRASSGDGEPSMSDLVHLRHAVARMREPVRELAVVRQQERTASCRRRAVRPGRRADRVGDELDDGRPSLRIARGRDDAGGLVAGARTRAAGVRPASPSTSTTSCLLRRPCSARRGSPFTRTRPSRISSSARRREATPAAREEGVEPHGRILAAAGTFAEASGTPLGACRRARLETWSDRLAELAVFGANVQPGQLVARDELHRQGGPHAEDRARRVPSAERSTSTSSTSTSGSSASGSRHAAEETLDYVPPWMRSGCCTSRTSTRRASRSPARTHRARSTGSIPHGPAAISCRTSPRPARS